MVALFCLERGGGHPATGPYLRNANWIATADGYASAVLRYAPDRSYGDSKISVSSNATVFVDGKVIGPLGSFKDRGCQVVAYRVPGGTFDTIGASQYYAGIADTSPHGGTMFGEMLFWQRPLTDEEMLDAQAYLAKKWLGKTMPGYQSDDMSDIPDVQELKVTLPTTLDVSEGRTATVRRLTADNVVVKTGVGTLAVGEGSDTSRLCVRGGSVKLARKAPAVAETCEVAKGAALHLDASRLDSFITVQSAGTNYVSRWYSTTGDRFAEQSTATCRPWLNDDPEALLNGHAVVDFGAFVSGSSGRTLWMSIANSMCSVRSAFIVRGSQAGGGTLLGEKYNSTKRNSVDFYRGSSATLADPIISTSSNVGPQVQNCDFYLDGVKTNGSMALPTGGYELIDVHPNAGAHVSALATMRGTEKFGGQRLAEVIIYERPLSEREIVATRNYLVQKWFPDRPLQDLPPEETPSEALGIREVRVSGAQSMDVDTPIAAEILDGDGTLEKTGASTLSVRDLSDFTGTVEVSEGAMAITGSQPAVEPALKESGRIVHFDATYGVQVLTNADSTLTATNWLSRAGGGWAAYCASTTPGFIACDLNGLPIVDLDSSDRMVFRRNGENAPISDCGTVFWVLGSQRGGGFLLGGGTMDTSAGNEKMAYYAWHRGGTQGRSPQTSSDPMWVGSGASVVGDGQWRVNGAVVSATASGTLSGGWDVISWRASAANKLAPAAGFAFDGRNYRYGCQALAEVIIYDHMLTDDEIAGVEAYLQHKWGFVQKSPANSAQIVLSEGASLVASGDQYVGSLQGAGSVEGNVTVKGFAATLGQSGFSVHGTLTVAANPEVAVYGLTPPVSGVVDIPVATADAILGDLSGATFTGVPEGVAARLRRASGTLSVRIGANGFLLLVR